ncbi:MAG: hypothetical protein ACKOC6_09250 [bacterium]
MNTDTTDGAGADVLRGRFVVVVRVVPALVAGRATTLRVVVDVVVAVVFVVRGFELGTTSLRGWVGGWNDAGKLAVTACPEREIIVKPA